jgi:hypothetical protein
MSNMKKYLPVIVAVALPLIFVIGVVIYATLLKTPAFEVNHKILMTDEESYVFLNDEGVVEIDEVKIENNNYYRVSSKEDVDFYIYDPEKEELEEVTYEEAKEFKLHPGKKSPDGVYVEYSYSRNDVAEMFGGNRQSGYYAVKDDKKIKLNTNQYTNYRSLEVIGWVIN